MATGGDAWAPPALAGPVRRRDHPAAGWIVRRCGVRAPAALVALAPGADEPGALPATDAYVLWTLAARRLGALARGPLGRVAAWVELAVSQSRSDRVEQDAGGEHNHHNENQQEYGSYFHARSLPKGLWCKRPRFRPSASGSHRRGAPQTAVPSANS